MNTVTINKQYPKSRINQVTRNFTMLLLTCLFFQSTLMAQEAILATGGSVAGESGMVCYSIGQILYSANTSASGMVLQGVQQPYEISVINGIAKANEIGLTYLAYPNPASDFLILKIKGDQLTQLRASLYDINGKLIQIRKLTTNETIIDMTNLLPTTYLLKVQKNQQEIRAFRIIKN